MIFKDVKTLGELKAAIAELQQVNNLDDDTPLATECNSQYDADVGIGVFPGFDNGGYISELFVPDQLVKAKAYVYVGISSSFPVQVHKPPQKSARQLMIEEWYRNRQFDQ